MYVLIDRERLVFLRKHGHQPTVSKLADLECPHHHAVVCGADSPSGFTTFTDLELKLLIKNTTGSDLRNVFGRETLLRQACQVAAQLEVDDVDGFELTMQVMSIKDNDQQRYQYVRGSKIPRCMEGLEELAGKVCAGAPLPQPASAPNVQGATTPAATPAQPASSDDFVMPKEGTSTHRIFMFCATLWKESGYSDNKATLDNIRKKAVDTLVPAGLNVSTVRTQAARWYQHRQRLVG